MQNLTRSARRRRAFLRINIALSICALGFTSLTMASKAKEALAYGPGDGVCANIIGSANCPEGSTDGGFEPFTRITCHQSSAWYQPGVNRPDDGPYYNCCLYTQRTRRCIHPNGPTQLQGVEYFQSSSNADASCGSSGSGSNSYCLYKV